LSESNLLNTTASVNPSFPDPIPGVLPHGSLCLFAAAAGAGKTIFQTEWIGRWLSGRTICGKKTNCPTGFYYLAADRDWSTYAAAFECAGVPESKIVKYVLAEDVTQNPLDWGKESPLNFLHRCIIKLNPIPGSILFIDPMAPLFVLGDQNRARDVAISMHFIRRMARQYNITIICNANVVKAKTDTEHKRLGRVHRLHRHPDLPSRGRQPRRPENVGLDPEARARGGVAVPVRHGDQAVRALHRAAG
jgi:RecA-family ATPase